MSLIHRARHLGRHRAKTPAELRAALDKADCQLIGLTTEIDQLTAHLDAAGINLSGAREDLRIATGHLDQAEQAIRDRDRRISELEHRLAVGVRAETIVATTQAMDMSSVRERFEHGPVRRLGASPLAAVTEPSGEDTVEIPVLREVA